MHKILKGLLSVLIHFTIGFVCCLIYILFVKKPNVLPQFSFSWKLAETGILFIRIMPSLLVSAILIGYAIIFGTCGKNTVSRYSQVLLHYLKEAFILLFLCITVYILLVEIIAPMLFRYRHYSETRTRDYYDFIKEADIALKNGQPDKAYDKLKGALGIWQNNPEALNLLDSVKLLHEQHNNDRKKEAEPKMVYTDAAPENLTAEKALAVGKRCMDSYDFYTAHYYAMRAYRLSPEGGIYRDEALRMAAEAWNQIEKGNAELTADFDVRLYRAKKAGYELLQQENYIKAYYQFVDAQQMIEQHDPLKRDPDIDRFVEITRQKLLEEVFFIDETEALSAFESARQISFIIPDSAFEATAKITIKALSFIPGKNVQEVYGRDCEITQYTADNKVKYKYHIPFVKFIPIIHKDGRHMLRMLFQAVDKQNDKIILRPIVIEGKMPVERQVSKLLPFSYDDFELIIAANTGEKSMTLPQLYTFRQTGPQYGFPAQIYHRELLARIGNVFLILIISIYMLVLAWRFRTPPYRQFKNSWALWFPVFFIIVTGFVETIRYCTRLMIVLFTDTFYTFSSALLLLVYILFFIGVSFLFIAQRSDG